MAKLSIAVFAAVLLAEATSWSSDDKATLDECSDGVCTVSMIRLVGNPERYEGKLVQTIGTGRFAFEAEAIFASQWHLDASDYSSAVWLATDPEKHRDLPQFNGKTVMVMGRFTTSSKGHKGVYVGELRDIKWLKAWPPTKR